jgi:hypothetical protein
VFLPNLTLTFSFLFENFSEKKKLNFYSFRKINRERNVWIYKHKLFHRDRPEDLYMVRRRTCPGVDGRKQRFSRFSAQKLSKFDEDKVVPNSDDETSSETTSGGECEETCEVPKKKRDLEVSSENDSSSKRSRRLWTATSKPAQRANPNVVVDTSIISNPAVSPTSVFDAHESLVNHEEEEEDDSSANKKNERLEMIEQSLIISEVATKLEEHARKALRGRGTSRTRRGVVGVVTPPWASSATFTVSTRGLITYDDEYEKNAEHAIAIDGDDSLISEPSINLSSDAKIDAKVICAPPVSETEAVKRIGNEIRRRAPYNFYNSEMITACANVAEFFMSTAPSEDVDVVSEKILQLLASSGKLAADFHFYRAALHPGTTGESPLLRYRFDQQQVISLRRTLQGGAGRRDALREFKIFCVNLIYRLLGKNGSLDMQEPFSGPDRSTLLRTAEVWSKSVGTSA